jgi:endonuclease YncB( thermonuclease family)
LALWLAASHADTTTGRVVEVAGGDALTVLSENGQQRIYLAGTEAPQKGQPYASRSWQNLMHIAYGKEATLHCRNVDRDQRKVCKVKVQPLSCAMCGHTLDVGLAQIVAGAARWYRKGASQQSEQDRGRYESEEREACLRRRGLWALPNATRMAHCIQISPTQ